MSFLKRFKSEFVANVAKLLAGKGVAFLITLGATPIVARLYDPSDYGVIAVFIGACTLMSILASLKYEMAIILPAEDDEARRLVRAIMHVGVYATLLMLVLVAIARYALSDTETVQKLGGYIWWLPAVMLLLVASRTLSNWFTRKKSFSKIATADVLMAATAASTRIIAGLIFGSTVAWLVVSFALGWLVLIVFLLIYARDMFTPLKQAKTSTINLLKQYAEFPLYSMPADMIRNFSRQMPLLLFGFMYSPAIAGLYYMAYRLILVPAEMGLQAFRRVYLQKIAHMKNANASLRPVYTRTLFAMAVTGLVPTLIVAFFGQEILTFVLGDKWAESGRYAEILAPLLYSFWLSSPAALMLVVLRRQKYWLWVQAFIAVGQVAALSYAYFSGKPIIWAITCFVWVQVLINLLMKIGVVALVNRHTR